jgi:hypothetical protein
MFEVLRYVADVFDISSDTHPVFVTRTDLAVTNGRLPSPLNEHQFRRSTYERIQRHENRKTHP